MAICFQQDVGMIDWVGSVLPSRRKLFKVRSFASRQNDIVFLSQIIDGRVASPLLPNLLVIV
jgi:hypothetical protein